MVPPHGMRLPAGERHHLGDGGAGLGTEQGNQSRLLAVPEQSGGSRRYSDNGRQGGLGTAFCREILATRRRRVFCWSGKGVGLYVRQGRAKSWSCGWVAWCS